MILAHDQVLILPLTYEKAHTIAKRKNIINILHPESNKKLVEKFYFSVCRYVKGANQTHVYCLPVFMLA